MHIKIETIKKELSREDSRKAAIKNFREAIVALNGKLRDNFVPFFNGMLEKASTFEVTQTERGEVKITVSSLGDAYCSTHSFRVTFTSSGIEMRVARETFNLLQQTYLSGVFVSQLTDFTHALARVNVEGASIETYREPYVEYNADTDGLMFNITTQVSDACLSRVMRRVWDRIRDEAYRG